MIDENQKLSHIDEQGKAKMVNVSDKEVTMRQAKAFCKLIMKKETLGLITSGRLPKGDVFATAKIAGIMAAKKNISAYTNVPSSEHYQYRHQF